MRINTNIASLNAQVNGTQTNQTLSSSLEKLSTGLRINKAADDASGMSIADKLRTQASSIGQAIQNANNGSALIQIADKAMGEQSNILDIVKTKLIQASTSTTSSEGREAIRKDISKLLDQLDNISSQTNYNGVNLLDTAGKVFSFQVGETSADNISAKTAYAVNTTGLGANAGSSSDVDSVLAFGSIASAIALSGKTDLTVSNATTLATGVSLAAVAINYSTSAVEFGATLASLASTTSFSIDANNVQRIVLNTTTSGSAADDVLVTTDDADMISILNGISNTNLSFTGTDGTYIFKDIGATISQGGNGVLDFGAGVDITSMTFSNVTMSQNASKNTAIFVVTESDVKITQLSNPAIGKLAIDSAFITATSNAGLLTAAGALQGTGSSNADGIVFSDQANVSASIQSGTSTYKVNQDTQNIASASIGIATIATAATPGATSATDASFSISADAVEKIMMSAAAGSVTLSTTDSDTMSLLSNMAKFDANINEVNPGNYTYSNTGGGNAELDFGTTGVDINNLTFSGVRAGTEGIYIQTDGAVSITKLGELGDQNISVVAANTVTDGTEKLQGVTTNQASVSGSLAGLKSLATDGLTSDVANNYMSTIDAALTQLNGVRSDFGSTQNQLSSATRNMMVTQVNIKAAESVIRDVDYAAESANFNKQNIIAQAGTYAMSQANAIQQNVLRLLQ